jgi:hypothetical protein
MRLKAFRSFMDYGFAASLHKKLYRALHCFLHMGNTLGFCFGNYGRALGLPSCTTPALVRNF